jgi:hypothetical protein
MGGESDQVTPVLLAFVTVAVNCCVWPCRRLTDLGLMVTETAGVAPKVTTALADRVPSAIVVAVTVMVCCVVIVAGAV